MLLFSIVMHKQQCTECNGDISTCTPTGPDDGEGVADADFVLYVTAIQELPCDNFFEVLAFASACEMEEELDRYMHNCNLPFVKHSNNLNRIKMQLYCKNGERCTKP